MKSKKIFGGFKLMLCMHIIVTICVVSLVFWVIFECVSEVSERGLKDIFQELWLGEGYKTEPTERHRE